MGETWQVASAKAATVLGVSPDVRAWGGWLGSSDFSRLAHMALSPEKLEMAKEGW